MTKVVFETAALASAVRKAARIAPMKGAAFDQAAGLVITVDPVQLEPVQVKATNTDVWYTEVIDATESSGDKVVWRLPSAVCASFISSLPVGSNQTVTLDDGDSGSRVTVSAGRTKVRLNTINPESYPRWDAFDDSLLEKISGLGGLLNRVNWAASRDGKIPYTGIHLTGTDLIATDRYRFAKVPCNIPTLEEPITIPFQNLTEIIKAESEIRIGVQGNLLLLMPDESTQVLARIYEADFPDVGKVMNRNRNKPNTITLPKAELTEAVKRCERIVQGERLPKMYFTIGYGIIQLYLADKSAGDIEEIIEIGEQAQHDYVRMIFTPKNLSEPLENCPSDQITIGYDATKPLSVLYIDGGNGYEAFSSPRTETVETHT